MFGIGVHAPGQARSSPDRRHTGRAPGSARVTSSRRSRRVGGSSRACTSIRPSSSSRSRGTVHIQVQARPEASIPSPGDRARRDHGEHHLRVHDPTGVGYIRVKNFAYAQSDELDKAVKKLTADGMEKLLLDLRDNPGGLLDQAHKVASKFIERGKTIVYTKGRAFGSAQTLWATGDEMPVTVPIVVLVNQASASASEIVSGAIQDHDRGLIVGETTWGKGLVQSVYQLPENTGLALTTAKYYTPSGRLIQRDYTHSFDDYLFPSRKAKTVPSDDQREIKYTDTGRKVYGGGGITPDVVVPQKEIEPGSFLDRIGADPQFKGGDIFFTFATGKLDPKAEITHGFEVGDDVLHQFSDHLKAEGITHTWEEIQANKDFLAIAIKKEIFNARFGTQEGYKVGIEGDVQVQKALTLFPEARQLAMVAHQQTARGGSKPTIGGESKTADGIPVKPEPPTATP
ncbi:MAG: S41 family peptidase [Acidobacteriota bacterium]